MVWLGRNAATRAKILNVPQLTVVPIDTYLLDLVQWVREFLPGLTKAVLISGAGWIVSGWARRAIRKAAGRMGGDAILWSWVGSFARYLILVVVLTSALKTAGFPVDSLLATFGISGVIIGFGARQAISNYFFGIMMLGARPFKQGDLIEFGPPPQIGVVTAVRMTFTSLDTLDNVRLVVPNSVIWRNKITNFSVHTDRAIRIPLQMAYDVDVDWVRDIALDVLKRHEAVLNHPAPRFMVSDMTSEKVKAQVIAWATVDTMNVFGDVIIQLRKDFETAGLTVTVPSADVDLKREE